MKTTKIQIKGNDKLRMKVDYSLFDNPESIKEFSECEDYTNFDFNKFFAENKGLHKDIIKQIQTMLNMCRSKRAYELGINPDIDNTLTKNEKYLVNDMDLYDIGKIEVFFDNKDKDFIDGLHNNLLKEISDTNEAFNANTKPTTFKLLQCVAIKSAHIARYLSKFPEYEKDGLVKAIHESLAYIKNMIARLLIGGLKDETFKKINEACLLLRINQFQAFIHKYYHEDKIKNAKIYEKSLRVTSDLQDLMYCLKNLGSKRKK